MKKILIVAANPQDTDRLRLDEEVREIDEGLRRSQNRSQFVIEQRWAVRIRDLRRALLDFGPTIVHFCGHGEVGGIILEDESGESSLVKPDALSRLFELFADRLECVLLNACYSELQSNAIGEHIGYVIGMNKEVADKSAIEFAVGFYDGLGAGLSVEKAYKLGCATIPEHLTPILRIKQKTKTLNLDSAFKHSVFSDQTTLLQSDGPSSDPDSSTKKPLTGNTKEDIKILVQHANDSLNNVLTRKHSDFFQKYISPVYAQRDDTEEKFQRFIKQRAYRCYMVTGRAGKGKTSLLCRLAELLTKPTLVGRRIPLLLSSADIELEKQSLEQIICKQLCPSRGGAMQLPGFIELAELLQRENTLLLIFIDAINELKGHDAFKRFNSGLLNLFEKISTNDYPILFCISCRSEFWPQFSFAEWARNSIFEPMGPEKPTHELSDFDESQINAIIQLYFDWYAIDGELLEGARKSCCDPIMLRYLCAAYTKRPPDDKDSPAEKFYPKYPLGNVRSLRRKEVFDRFVQAKRVAQLKAAEAAVDLSDTRALYELTTRYLITMANEMYKQGRAYITIQEAIEIAHRLNHPDANLEQQLGTRGFLNHPNSIFFRLIDEGIILDKYGHDTFEFVFETYLEYSLGRYIALERWPALCPDRKLDPEKVKADLEGLLEQHSKLVESKSFTNIFGALQFAILVTEDDDLYKEHPFLFIKLIQCMSEITERGFNWIQQACATTRETALAQAGTWQILKDQPEKLTLAQSKFQQLLNVLDKFTKLTDFVILWDVENTLRALAIANFDLTIERMYLWVVEGTGLQPIFATQALARLSFIRPQAIAGILLELSRLPRYRKDFWLSRSLIFATLGLARRRRELELSAKDWILLNSMVQEFASDQSPDYIRGVAIAALPFLSNMDESNLNWITKRMAQEPWAWALWNLVFELQRWPTIWPDDWIWQTLDTLANHTHPHVRYAIDKTTQILQSRNRNRATGVERKIQGNRWRTSPSPGRSDKTKDGLIGIIYSPAYLEPAYDNHVECRERIQAIIQKLITVCSEHINWVDPRAATETELSWAHNKDTDRHRDRSPWPSYVEDVKRASLLLSKQIASGNVGTGPSELRYESYEAALLSAGGVLQAVDYVLNGSAPAAFSLGRPPGHLANNAICIFNNIAIGAHYARRQYGKKRILIVDCDAHHGSHTNWVFLSDPDVLYFSLHIEGDYAREEGLVQHIGKNDGEGYNFNLPYPKFMSDAGYAYMIDALLTPLAHEFKPELIMISAGFDGHFDDPLTPGCILSENAYVHLATKLHEVAEQLNIKIVGSLEGGYGLEGMANSFAHMLRIIGNLPFPAEKIGFTPFPENYNEWLKNDSETMTKVKAQVKRRIELMADVKHRNPGYVFDIDQSHWQSILADSG